MGVETGDSRAVREPDVDEIIEINDPGIDVEAIMTRVRENVARRRAEGAYREDLDAIAREVWAEAAQNAPALPSLGPGLEAVLPELNTHWTIREFTFVSHVPVVGPLIAAIRTAWNWVSTKWYVQSILRQQVEFNALAVQAFNAFEAERRAAQGQAASLQARCARHEEEVRALAAEVALLRARLDAVAPETGAVSRRDLP